MVVKYVAIAMTLGLTACATSGSPTPQPDTVALGPVDDMGFAARDNMAFYHVATGLYCPAELGGLLRSSVKEFRKDVDVGCVYRNDNRIVTLYMFETGGDMGGELASAVSAALQGGLGNRLEVSDANTEVCQMSGTTYNLGMSIMSLAAAEGVGDAKISIDPSGASGALPYMAAAMEGAGIRSYASVSQTDDMMLKVRYTAKGGEDDAEAVKADCKALHHMTAMTALATGKPDGPEMDSMSAILLGDLSDSVDD